MRYAPKGAAQSPASMMLTQLDVLFIGCLSFVSAYYVSVHHSALHN